MRKLEEFLVAIVLILIISILGYLINELIGFGTHPFLANIVFALIVINLYMPLRYFVRKLILRVMAPTYFERNRRFREFLDELTMVETYREMLELVPNTIRTLFEADIVALFVRRKGIFKVEASLAPAPMVFEGLYLDSEHELLKQLRNTKRHLLHIRYSINDLNPEFGHSDSMDYRSFKMFQWAIPLTTNGTLAGFILLDKMPKDMQLRRSGTLYNHVVEQIAVLLDKRKLYHRIRLEALKQKTLTLIAETMTATRNTTRIFNLLLDEIKKIIPYDACGVFLASAEGPNIEKFLQRGYNARRLNPLKLKIGRGIVGRCIATQQPISIRDVQREKNYIAGRSNTRSELCVPIASGNRVYGAMNLESNQVAAFSDDDLDFLHTIATQAGVLMERYDMERKVDMQAEFSADIEKAESIQRSLLPQNIPVHDDVEFHIQYLPCKQVSGDFYDLMPREENVFSLAIGDVVGKGISGALIMSSFYAAYLNEIHRELSLDKVMANLNLYLIRDTELDEQVTFFLSKLNVEKRLLQYVNGGHPAPLLFHRDGSYERLETGGALLGFDQKFTYEQGEVQLIEGDLLVLYTDGLTEIVGHSGQLFDESGLIDELQQHLGESPEQISKALLTRVQTFSRKNTFKDDLTLLIVRYKGDANSL